MRTIVYVDGFNLYYGQLKGTLFKWLDLEALFRRVLSPASQIIEIKYFTARVQPSATQPDVHIRQDAYLQAIAQCCPLVRVHFGHFLRHKVRMGNAHPPPATLEVWKSEEKGSDVNLAIHVLNDAWLNAYDCAVIVSNDSDLSQAMAMVKQHHPAKKLGLVTPGAPLRKTSQQLAVHADFRRTIRVSALQASQLPANIPVPGPVPGIAVAKPVTW